MRLMTVVLVGILLALATALPLAWKWQLGLRRATVAVGVLAAVSALLVVLLGSVVSIGGVLAAALVWLLTVALAVATIAYRFYRDPERTPPEGDDAILSPADGEVLYVRESREGMLPVSSKLGRDYALHELTKTALASEDAVVVGIGLSFLDVHVNRSPLRGRLTLQRRFRGRFASLRRPEAVFENERATFVIDRGDVQVAVVLIASRLVRRIVTYVREGQELAAGQRIGMIRFGSQADVVLPLRDDLQVAVRRGDRVLAGETVIAQLQGVHARAAPALEHARST